MGKKVVTLGEIMLRLSTQSLCSWDKATLSSTISIFLFIFLSD